MTKTELERLAVVEAMLAVQGADITEVKRDVKSLVAARNSQSGVMTFIGKALPMLISAGALVVAFLVK